MEELKNIYEKKQLTHNLAKLLNISRLTFDLFDNDELKNIKFVEGPCKNMFIHNYINKYFSSCSIYPTSIYCRIINSLNDYYKKNLNNDNINKYINDIKEI